MGLSTSKFFLESLKQSAEITDIVGDNIRPTSFSADEADEDLLPYIIVCHNGLDNTGQTKDNSVEGDEDDVKIKLVLASQTYDGMVDLAETVRKVLDKAKAEMSEEQEAELDAPDDWTFSTGPFNYDDVKPCHWVELFYDCVTKP